jgi:ABC-type phosphate transport system substrate-binding protein
MAAVAVLWAALPATAQPPFVIVVNKDNPVASLTVVELQRIFRKQTRMWPHAEAIVPVDWDATSEIRQEFCRRVLGRSVREMAEFWVQQSVTQGLAPPSTQKSARAVLRFVASVPGAISYVRPDEVDDSVKTIKVAGIP